MVFCRREWLLFSTARQPCGRWSLDQEIRSPSCHRREKHSQQAAVSSERRHASVGPETFALLKSLPGPKNRIKDPHQKPFCHCQRLCFQL